MISIFLWFFHAALGMAGLIPAAISCMFYPIPTGREFDDLWGRAKCFGLLSLILFTTLNLFEV